MKELRNLGAEVRTSEIVEHLVEAFSVGEPEIALVVEILGQRDVALLERLAKCGEVQRLALGDRAVEIEEDRSQHARVDFRATRLELASSMSDDRSRWWPSD